jgi:predicted Zn-dependent protease
VSLDARVEDTLDALRRGFAEVELYAKKGRSRIFQFGGEEETSAFRQEEGWAVRAGDASRSFFQCAAGPPDPDFLWPEPRLGGLHLPPAQAVPPWTPPADLEAPLLSEGEARALIDALGRELEAELPAARIVRGRLEDGVSQAQILNSHDLRHTTRQRIASLVIDAQLPPDGVNPLAKTVTVEVAARCATQLQAPAIARRIADRLYLAARGSSPLRDRADVLLGPEVTAGLLAALADLFLGPGGEDRRAFLFQRSPTMGSRGFTLIDHGRLPGGLLNAPVDGEGTPTGEVVLVDRGVFCQPLVAWHQAAGKQQATGCVQRPGWRDWPQPGFSHLFLKPNPAISVGSLLGDLQRGYYLIGRRGAARIEAGHLRFALPVEGFAISGGQAREPIGDCWLTGAFTTFLNGIMAVGRDLTLVPWRGTLIGAPTILVRGLELRRNG